MDLGKGIGIAGIWIGVGLSAFGLQGEMQIVTAVLGLCAMFATFSLSN